MLLERRAAVAHVAALGAKPRMRERPGLVSVPAAGAAVLVIEARHSAFKTLIHRPAGLGGGEDGSPPPNRGLAARVGLCSGVNALYGALPKE